jgi:PTS system mannose-specific IIB component
MITLVRVDDRVIHGQTITAWMSAVATDGILIVDDELANNEMMKSVYKNTVPADMKLLVFSVEKALQKLKEAQVSNKKYYVIFRSVFSLNQLIQKGGQFDIDINVGPSSNRPNTTMVVPTISLTKEELDCYRQLGEGGIKFYFQVVPSLKKVWWSDIVKGK